MTTTARVGRRRAFRSVYSHGDAYGDPGVTRLTVLVPPGTIDGSIRVSTFNDVLGEGADLIPASRCRHPRSTASRSTTREASR